MNAGAKLAAYGAVLVAAFGVGAAIGDAVGPIDVGDDTSDHDATVHDTIVHDTIDHDTGEHPDRP